MSITLYVNGRAHALEVADDTPLLYVLRNDLGLNGPKFGCGLGQCGSCAVLIGGKVVLSCRAPVGRVEGEVTTLEGLGDRESPHPLQSAFIEAQAMQCGYCINGMIIAAAALLAETQSPSDAEIREALAGNLCRCGAHGRILAAVKAAARDREDEEAPR